MPVESSVELNEKRLNSSCQWKFVLDLDISTQSLIEIFCLFAI